MAHGSLSHEVSGTALKSDACVSTRCCYLLPRTSSAQMSLIFSEGSLADIHPPCVLQSFVNHGAVLHKVFVVGDQHFCVERPSLKNFPSGPCGQPALLSSPSFSHPSSFFRHFLFRLFLPVTSSPFLFFSLLSRCHVLYYLDFLCSICSLHLTVISFCLQTGRQSFSTAIRCPSQSRALISQQ